jgi:bis(5'-nucleosyl)-tetraphosphatase (symmetrical)
MATWAIGDIHGCHRTLRRLLKRIGFDPSRDRLWLTGDLVNRGPDSLGVLRWARDLEDRITMVLGNHDLHLLGVAWGVVRGRSKDTFEDVLGAGDRDELLEWLRHRPLAHAEGSYLLVHAGVLPEWSVAETLSIARKLETVLTSPEARRVIELYRGGNSTESFELLALRAFTQLRMLDGEGRPLSGFSGPPEEAPPGVIPWFDHPDRQSRTHCIVCGHWAGLGLSLRPDLFALDSGCAWKGRLTAVCLNEKRLEQVEYSE